MKLSLALTASVALSLLAASVKADEPKPPAMPVRPPDARSTITNPDWIALPSGDQLNAYYPDLAQVLNLAGEARMGCEVTATGSLTNCSIVSETPAGIGFGQAALGMSKFFQMRPKTVNGQPVGGAGVVIPLKFVRPQTATDSTEASDAPPINPDSLALARRLAVATGVRNQVETNFLAYFHMVQLRLGAQADTPEAKAALDAFAVSAEAASDGYVEAMAEGYARSFTLVELHQIVDFYESSAGQVWVMNQALDRMKRPAMEGLMRSARLGAIEALCKKTRCPPEDEPAH